MYSYSKTYKTTNGRLFFVDWTKLPVTYTPGCIINYSMLMTKFPFKENGWWVVYDYRKLIHNYRLIKLEKLSGKALIIISLLLISLFFSPFVRKSTKAEVFVEHPLDKLNLNPADKSFSLIVPKLNINVSVAENVDSQRRENFEPYLQKGVAQARGTALPNEPGNVFIFGHSSDYPWINNPYSTIFTGINELKPEDKIFLIYKDNLYTYRTVKHDIVNPQELSYLYPNKNGNKLYLQTCWPIGTDWQRIIVTADLDKVDPI